MNKPMATAMERGNLATIPEATVGPQPADHLPNVVDPQLPFDSLFPASSPTKPAVIDTAEGAGLPDLTFLDLSSVVNPPLEKKPEKASTEENGLAAAGLVVTTLVDLRGPVLPILAPDGEVAPLVGSTNSTEQEPEVVSGPVPRVQDKAGPVPVAAPTQERPTPAPIAETSEAAQVGVAHPAKSSTVVSPKSAVVSPKSDVAPQPAEPVSIASASAKTSVVRTPSPPEPTPVEKTVGDFLPVNSSLKASIPTAGTDTAKQQVTMSIADLKTRAKGSLPQAVALTAPTGPQSSPLPAISPSRDFSSNDQQEQPASGSPEPKVADSTVQVSAHLAPTEARPAETAQPVSRTEQADRIFNVLTEATEKLRTDGHTNVEMQIKLRDGEVLTVKLQMHGGEVRTIFRTDSIEMREAIARGWSDFSNRSTERGLTVTTPVFESPAAQSGLNDSPHQREQHHEQAEANRGRDLPFPTPGKQKAKLSTPLTPSRLPNPSPRSGSWAAWA